MYERFTDRARKVMQLANQEAQRFNHEYIGTEHILLGLIKEGSGVAANVLKNLDIDLRTISYPPSTGVRRIHRTPLLTASAASLAGFALSDDYWIWLFLRFGSLILLGAGFFLPLIGCAAATPGGPDAEAHRDQEDLAADQNRQHLPSPACVVFAGCRRLAIVDGFRRAQDPQLIFHIWNGGPLNHAGAFLERT